LERNVPDIVSLKMLGVAGVVSYAAARLATKAGIVGYRRFAMVSVPLAGMPDMPRGFTVRELTPAALSQLTIDVPQPVQAGRFAQGLNCLGAFNPKDELVGVTWVGSEPFTETLFHVRFAVPDDAAWDTGLWIVPKHRLGRGFAALWAGTADWMRANGKRSSMSWIADYNLPSLMSHKRMGALTLGRITILRVFSWQYMAEGRPRLVRIHGGPPADILLAHHDIHRAFREKMA
jgi:hypothetical protein